MDDQPDVAGLSLGIAAATGAPLAVAADSPIDALIQDYADARNAREAADEEAKRLRETEQQYEQKLFDALEKQGLRSVKHARGSFSLNDLAWASIADAEKARQWAEASMPELLTLNTQKLSVIVRETIRGEREDLAEADLEQHGITYRLTRGIKWRRS